MTLPSEHMSPAEPPVEALGREMLSVALAEARHGASEGGIPIGAAIFPGVFIYRARSYRVFRLRRAMPKVGDGAAPDSKAPVGT